MKPTKKRIDEIIKEYATPQDIIDCMKQIANEAMKYGYSTAVAHLTSKPIMIGFDTLLIENFMKENKL